MSIQTIVLSYTSINEHEINCLQKQLSNVVRYAYKRSNNGWDQKQTRNAVKNLNSISKDSFFNQCAVMQGFDIAKSANVREQTKVIFGSKKMWEKRQRNEITNQEWKQSRLLPIYSIGETNQKGNRKFVLDMDKKQIIFKSNKCNHFVLNIDKIARNQLRLLKVLEKQCVMMQNCFTVKLTASKIYISFEQLSTKVPIKKSRYAGIDLNPNYLGFVICDNDKVIFQKLYDLTDLNKIKNTNKKKHEKIAICKDIHKQLIHFQVDKLCLEDLDIKSKNHNKGKTFNKLVNNLWNKKLFTNQLTKDCDISGIIVKPVIPAYSSFIGNLVYELPDALSSALEVARRGYEKSSGFYPCLISVDNLANRWKDASNWSFSNWVTLFGIFKSKNLMSEYRVSMSRERLVFKRFIRKKSKVFIHVSDIKVDFCL